LRRLFFLGTRPLDTTFAASTIRNNMVQKRLLGNNSARGMLRAISKVCLKKVAVASRFLAPCCNGRGRDSTWTNRSTSSKRSSQTTSRTFAICRR
jgi:hypothetical protein